MIRPPSAILPFILCLAAAPAFAEPPKRPPIVWPLPNPTFEQADFTPTTHLRQISGVFGPRLKWGSARYDHHEGFDFFAFFDPAIPDGRHPVFAVMPGVVSDVIDPPNPERTETGRKIVITHPIPWSAFGAPADWGPVQTGYLHLSRIEVQQGQQVGAGDTIGHAGDSGYTSTVHLHLNAYRAGGRAVNVNPARLFTPKQFPRAVVPLHKRTVAVEWLERDLEAGTALARVTLAYNAYTLDGFVVQVGRDTSRAISFEAVSANLRDRRDTGDADLFPGVRLFPLRYNGGGPIDQVNGRSVPAGWPLARYPVAGGQGVRLGFDVLATGLSPNDKKLKLHVIGVGGEHLTYPAKGFRAIVGR